LRIDGLSVAERSRAGCKEQRSVEYLRYSSERRHLRGRAGELCSTALGAGGVEPCQGSTFSRRPDSARHATPGGYAQQAPRVSAVRAARVSAVIMAYAPFTSEPNAFVANDSATTSMASLSDAGISASDLHRYCWKLT
jgi:hypothetical protein